MRMKFTSCMFIINLIQAATRHCASGLGAIRNLEFQAHHRHHPPTATIICLYIEPNGFIYTYKVDVGALSPIVSHALEMNADGRETCISQTTLPYFILEVIFRKVHTVPLFLIVQCVRFQNLLTHPLILLMSISGRLASGWAHHAEFVMNISRIKMKVRLSKRNNIVAKLADRCKNRTITSYLVFMQVHQRCMDSFG